MTAAMILQQALQQLVGRTDLFAARRRGVIIKLSDRMMLQDVRIGRPRPYQPVYSDLLADDWAVMDAEGVRKAFGSGELEATE